MMDFSRGSVCCVCMNVFSCPRRAVHQTPHQSDGVPGERREAGLRRPGGDGARHRVAEGRREALQH